MQKDSARAGWLTVAIAAGLVVSMSPEAAKAYASATTPAAQIDVLRNAIATGSAVTQSDGATILSGAEALKRIKLAGSNETWNKS